MENIITGAVTQPVDRTSKHEESPLLEPTVAIGQSSIVPNAVQPSKRVRRAARVGGRRRGKHLRLFCQSSASMPQCADESIALTVTSPPYWNAIDYDIHASRGSDAWHREREYRSFGETFDVYLDNVTEVFREVYRVTVAGGFCSIVIGTILYQKKHYPAPMLITERLVSAGWEFHQDIIWNKVTGGVKRAGSFIQHPKSGYYYPNIMTEYVLVFRKSGKPRRGAEPTLEIDDVFTRDIANNVWHIAPVPPNTIEHPCPFPEELVRRLVSLYSDRGDEVLDPFLGSGQTAIVSSRLGRRFVGYDIEQEYLRLTERRLANPQPVREFNLIPRYDKVSAK